MEMIGSLIGPARSGADEIDSATHWLSRGRVKKYRRGQPIIEIGQPLDEWIVLSKGAACCSARTGGSSTVVVGTLWLGDVIGAVSPLGHHVARFGVTALVDVTTLQLPSSQLASADAAAGAKETGDLYLATAERLQSQIARRLAGNGLQRLVSVLGILAEALHPVARAYGATSNLIMPVSQTRLGALAGLSRRQCWIYLGHLRERGWVVPNRSSVALEFLPAWLRLNAVVEREGMDCIGTMDKCDATLKSIVTLMISPDGPAI